LQETAGATSRVEFQLVSDNFFSVLGLSPSAGRFFLDGDDQREQSEWPVILRYDYFKQHFAENQPVLGKRTTFNGVPIVIVGVAPKGFSGVVRGQAPDLWLESLHLLAQGTVGHVRLQSSANKAHVHACAKARRGIRGWVSRQTNKTTEQFRLLYEQTACAKASSRR